MARRVEERFQCWQQQVQLVKGQKFVGLDELNVQVDETSFTKENKLKDLQEVGQLGLPSSGLKIKVLTRLQKYKRGEEERIAYEIA